MLAYDVRGRGDAAVLLLHGFLGSGRNLASLARRWSEADASLRFVLPDLRGHGASPPLPAGATLHTLARDVLDLADALRLPRPLRVVGHSLGGRVGLAMRLVDAAALDHLTLLDIGPSALQGLHGALGHVLQRLLVAPSTTADRQSMRAFFTDDGISGPLADWLLMNLLHEGGALRWRIDRASLGQFHRVHCGTDLWPAVHLSGARLHCIRGADSDFVPEAEASRLRDADVEVHTLAGAGHFVHVDAQDALLDLLRRQP